MHTSVLIFSLALFFFAFFHLVGYVYVHPCLRACMRVFMCVRVCLFVCKHTLSKKKAETYKCHRVNCIIRRHVLIFLH